ncbi:MAG: hypothetical protein HDS66_06680 [Bacteroidales bacterium]|nr:hypothetical protein [Bacteroidales bacterium]
MMITTELTTGGHHWIKTNIVTQGKNKLHDSYRCELCGITGKSYALGSITVPEQYRNKLNRCPGLKPIKRIKVTVCRAVGPQFQNLTPGSVHDVITPPAGENSKNGVWVQGVGEPVKLLFGEFEHLKQ